MVSQLVTCCLCLQSIEAKHIIGIFNVQGIHVEYLLVLSPTPSFPTARRVKQWTL